jgi:hypothetical protein
MSLLHVLKRIRLELARSKEFRSLDKRLARVRARARARVMGS